MSGMYHVGWCTYHHRIVAIVKVVVMVVRREEVSVRPGRRRLRAAGGRRGSDGVPIMSVGVGVGVDRVVVVQRLDVRVVAAVVNLRFDNRHDRHLHHMYIKGLGGATRRTLTGLRALTDGAP